MCALATVDALLNGEALDRLNHGLVLAADRGAPAISTRIESVLEAFLADERSARETFERVRRQIMRLASEVIAIADKFGRATRRTDVGAWLVVVAHGVADCSE